MDNFFVDNFSTQKRNTYNRVKSREKEKKYTKLETLKFGGSAPKPPSSPEAGVRDELAPLDKGFSLSI